jgi:NCS2 family nucleobase:cation symporter-2
MALRHAAAAVVGIITPAIIVAACRLPADQRPLLIQASLVMSGLATLVRPSHYTWPRPAARFASSM